MINVTKTYLPKLEQYGEYVNKIFQSGILTNNGKLVRELEDNLRNYLGVKNILLVSNGTLALQVAYKLLGLTEETITTPFSFAATVSSQVWEGLTPSFVDIDTSTFNINPKLLPEKLSSKTSGIVGVHVFGNCCEVEEIDVIAKDHDLKVVYDAAHAFGVKYNGESVLNFGDISTLSFHATKIFHTIEGGALIIKDDVLYERAKLMINFGIDGPDRISDLGINAKMNEFQAAMGLCVLEDMDSILQRRKVVYEYYMNHLSNKITFQKRNEKGTNNFSYFPILLESEEDLLHLIDELKAEGINPRRYFYPSLNSVPYIKNSPSLPVAESISRRILCLPLYDSLELADQKKIISIINKNR